MERRTTDYRDYDVIIEGLVDFWLRHRARPGLEFCIFCDQLEQHLGNALDELNEWVEIDL